AADVQPGCRDAGGARVSYFDDEGKYELAIRGNATRDAHRFDHWRGRRYNALGRCAARPDEMEMNDMRRMSHEPAECIRLPNHLLRTRWPTRFAIEAQFREGEFGNAQSVVRRLPLDRILRHKRNVIGKYVATAK